MVGSGDRVDVNEEVIVKIQKKYFGGRGAYGREDPVGGGGSGRLKLL